MHIEVVFDALTPVDDVVVGIALYNSMGWMIFGTNTEIHGIELGTVSGRCRVTFECSDVPLLDGIYAVTVGVHTVGGLVYDQWEQRKRFEVATPGRDAGLVRFPIEIRTSSS